MAKKSPDPIEEPLEEMIEELQGQVGSEMYKFMLENTRQCADNMLQLANGIKNDAGKWLRFPNRQANAFFMNWSLNFLKARKQRTVIVDLPEATKQLLSRIVQLQVEQRIDMMEITDEGVISLADEVANELKEADDSKIAGEAEERDDAADAPGPAEAVEPGAGEAAPGTSRKRRRSPRKAQTIIKA